MYISTFFGKKDEDKKKVLTHFVHVLTDFNTLNTYIGTLKHIIINLTRIRTHYAPKLFAKDKHKLCVQLLCAKILIMRLIMRYAPQAKLCARANHAFFTRSHNRIILKRLKVYACSRLVLCSIHAPGLSCITDNSRLLFST